MDTLAASISEDSGTLEDVYEPYLLKCGFIQRTPRGRVVTDLAYRHLGILPPVSRLSGHTETSKNKLVFVLQIVYNNR